MSQDEIDRILSRDGEILPSSGFTASVMEAVRREAAVPPPIPFPWKRALPLMVVACAVLVFTCGAVVEVLRKAATVQPSTAIASPFLQMLSSASSPMVGWTLVSLVLTFASVMFSLRFARGRT